MNKKIILISLIIVFLIILIVSIILSKKNKRKKMQKKVTNLDIIKNDVLSLPLLAEIEKVSNLAKGEQLEEKINNYKKIYEDLKNNSFKKIEDMILELDFLIQENPKEFYYKYSLIELELYRNRYLINHIIAELKELTSYEDKYRGMVIKLKNKYRIINREYESNKDLYGTLIDTIDMQFENIEKRFQDFEIVINENLYNEVVLVVRSLDTMIEHIGCIVLELPDILVLLNDLIPSRIKELELLRNSYIWIPCNVIVSEKDQKNMEEASIGMELQFEEDVRLIPDILMSDDDYYFPVFTSDREMGEYGQHFSKVEKHFLEAIALARANEKDIKGIVIDAFTEPMVIDCELFEVIENLKSRL